MSTPISPIEVGRLVLSRGIQLLIARLGRFQHQKVVPRRQRRQSKKSCQRGVNHGEPVPNLLPQDWAQRPPHP